MSKNPRLEIDYPKLEHNAIQIVNKCSRSGIDVVGVTKGVCGHVGIAKSLMSAGVKGLADARLENIKRLRRSNPRVPLFLLRSPMPSEISEVVRWVDISFQTEIWVIEMISQAAARLGRVHDIILMIDVGDIREGILPMNARWQDNNLKRYMPGMRVCIKSRLKNKGIFLVWNHVL